MGRYSQVLLEHARSPRNAGKMCDPDAIGKSDLNGRAPYTTIYLRVEDGVVADVSFQTFGCGVLIAACSVLTEMMIGHAVKNSAALTASNVAEGLGGIPPDKQFCADLAISAMQSALSTLQSQPPSR